MKRYLTKSRFKLAVECPTKLFYTGKDFLYRNLKKEDSFMEALAEGGFQVGKMATMLFPTGIEVKEKSNTDALYRTQELLRKHEEITLFEPAFAFDNLFVRVDILVKKGNKIELIEVKAKSYDSVSPKISGDKTPILSDMRPYIEDVSFQRHVVSKALPAASISCFLMMPDKSVQAALSGLNQCFKIRKLERSTEVIAQPDAARQVSANERLLAKVPVDEFINIVMATPLAFPGPVGQQGRSLTEVVGTWAASYEADEKIAPTPHKGCSHCEFREDEGGKLKSGYHECIGQAYGLSHAEIEQGTVLDIWNYRGKDKLLAQGVVRLSQVNEDDIKIKADKDGLSNSQRQWLQVAGIPKVEDKGGFYFDADLFRDQMRSWRYPLHMIDFETSTVALPFFPGMRPYESVAFQFSHHVIYEDGTITHKDQALFSSPGHFPNFDFLRALKVALGTDDGSIFRWATHENTILRHIREQLLAQTTPESDLHDLVDFIDRITDNGSRAMIDLNKIALRTYFHPKTKGKTSIKKVLPAVMSTSDYLKTKYSRPVYGADIASLNFPEGFVWYEEVGGTLRDPYGKLKSLALEMLSDDAEDFCGGLENMEIAEGGAAAMAYARLQFEHLTADQRVKIEQALLRYCELDTFAMVMIFEAWREWSE